MDLTFVRSSLSEFEKAIMKTYQPGAEISFKRLDGEVVQDIVRHEYEHSDSLHTNAPAVVLTKHSWCLIKDIVAERFKEGTPMCCPHCGEDLMAKVEDFVIPNKVGPTSIPYKPSDCGDCDKLFNVQKLPSGEYEVVKVRGFYSDLDKE